MWFSKHRKLSKQQYEEARNADKFKVHTKEEWLDALKSLTAIEYKYNVRDSLERNFFYISKNNWYPKDDQPDESWLYHRVKTLLMYIGDGWGKGYIRTETVYITDDFIISDASGHHTFTELENGDLLVKEEIVTKKSDTRTITEIDPKRYNCGKWRKKIIESEYSKFLIDEEDFDIISNARRYCNDFETINNLEKNFGKKLQWEK